MDRSKLISLVGIMGLLSASALAEHAFPLARDSRVLSQYPPD